MTVHRYPLRALVGDYARSAIGFGLTGGPLLLVSPGSAMIWVLAPLAVLFAAFGARTVFRQATQVEMSDVDIRQVGPFGTTISWERLDVLRLRYYSSKRGRSRSGDTEGWMQAVIGGDGRRINLDSALGEFEAIVARAADVALRRSLALDEATLHNLRAMGLVRDGAL